MKRNFKVLSTRKEVDIFEYIKDYLNTNNNVSILIGCDSQNKGAYTLYALVIGLYKEGKGAHVLYEKTTELRGKKYNRNTKDFSYEYNRLMKEVWMSVELAEQMKKEGLPKIQHIDIDISDDPKYKSNVVLASAVGLITGLGYSFRSKGSFPMMNHCADSIIK